MPPPLGPAWLAVWQLFDELTRRRQLGEHIPGPLTHSEIRAMQDNLQLRLTPSEIEVLLFLDDLYLASKAQPAEDATTP